MARHIWTGAISFGLVNIPVRLHTLVREQRVSFHLLHDKDHARLKRKLLCSLEDKEVHPEHIIRGFEVSPGKFVTVRDAELEALAPEASRTIDIRQFVASADVPPIYYDHPYMLSPGEGAAKAYALLLGAMRESDRVGVAKFVMHEKEHLATLRPLGDVICLSTMHFADEVQPADEVVPPSQATAGKEPGEAELRMAVELIESMSTDFDPKRYRDEYRHRVQQMLKKKEEGEAIVAEPVTEDEAGEPTSAKKAVSLMRALELSLAKSSAGAAKGGAKRKSSKRRKTVTT